jgi:hypothetical protein
LFRERDFTYFFFSIGSKKKNNNERASSIWIFSDGKDLHAREDVPEGDVVCVSNLFF